MFEIWVKDGYGCGLIFNCDLGDHHALILNFAHLQYITINYIQQMSFWKKLFSTSAPKQRSNAILIHLDADLKKSIEVRDQTVRQYELESNFDEDQFLYLMILNKKINEVMVKRKLNRYERFSECLEPPSEDTRCYLIIGYGSQRSTIPKINSNLPLVENMKFIRSGVLSKYNDLKNSFEECQLKLHHDYLTFYKFKQTEKKVSFMPLQNSIVEIVNQKKCMFSVRDKFNCTIFKTSSKEDMYSWLVAITEAIKIRNSQIYMNQMEDKLHKAVKGRINSYIGKCTGLRDQSRVIPLDDIGRKALKSYFRKHKVPQQDSKLLSIIQAYLFMCKCRRQKGEAHSQQIYQQLRISITQMQKQMPSQIQMRDLSSKNQFVKTIEEIMKYLDGKYRKEIIDKRNIYGVFQNYLLEQYREDRKITVKTLFRNDPQF